MIVTDTSAFLELYDDALPHVYGYLARRCANAATAEDLTAETFMAAVAALAQHSRQWQPVGPEHCMADRDCTAQVDRPLATDRAAQGGARRTVERHGRAGSDGRCDRRDDRQRRARRIGTEPSCRADSALPRRSAGGRCCRDDRTNRPCHRGVAHPAKAAFRNHADHVHSGQETS